MKLIPFSLILVLILSAWLLPSAIPVLGIVIIVISLSIAFFSVFRKHRTAYLQGNLTRAAFLCITFLDIFGILLAIILAGWLGQYLAWMFTRPISNATVKLIAGIIIGLLVGLSIGLVVNRTWERLVTSAGKQI